MCSEGVPIRFGCCQPGRLRLAEDVSVVMIEVWSEDKCCDDRGMVIG